MASDSSKKELYLVDGSGFIFRAYFAIAYGSGQALTNPEGVPVGAVYIFTNMMLKLLQDYDAPYMAVIFDAARKNFRNDIYADYKANRDEPPEDLVPQFPIIRDAAKAFDLPVLEQEGYEADDLIAAYTKEARSKGIDVVIVSSDKDLMQLVGPGVRMLDPMKQDFIDEDGVVEKFGVKPDRVVDVQALAGDSTDNVPGVPGIGIKTAASLIEEYGSLDNLLDNLDQIKQPKRRETLKNHIEDARISAKLVKLDDNAPMPVALDDLQTNDVSDNTNLIAFLKSQGFTSTLKRLGAQQAENEVSSDIQQAKEPENLPPVSKNSYHLITDEKTLRDWIKRATDKGRVAFDTETTSLTPAKSELVGISLAVEIGEAAYVPLGHRGPEPDLLSDNKKENDTPQIDKEKALDLLKTLFEDESVLKIAHNAKYDWQILKLHGGIDTAPIDDTMLISYVLSGGQHSHGLTKLSEEYFGHTPIEYKSLAGKGKNQVTFDKVPIDQALDYAAEDAELALRLHHILHPRLAEHKQSRIYEDIDRPLIRLIGQMELHGIKVDPATLKDMSDDFQSKINALEEEIKSLSEYDFNIGSPKQVGEVLFGEMGLPGGKKTKSGQWQTDVATLEKLAHDGHDIVRKILDWRGLSKLKSTYTDALQTQISPKTGRIHTSFSLAHTSTGRLASSDPNLQNIPIRSEEGRKIRTAFIPEKDHILLAADYSQVELRLAADMAGIEALKTAFKNDDDIHTLTASQVFDLDPDKVTAEQRRQAKAVNFGIIYGISAYGLAKQLDCPTSDARNFIDKYLSRFSELQDYMEAKKEEARKNGYVETLYGRRCYINNIDSKNQAQRGGADRAAINAPLQGTAADIMKLAMVNTDRELKRAGLKAKILLQVHDEMILEVPEEEIEKTRTLVKETMEQAYKVAGVSIDVPLIVETGTGQSWAEAH